MNTTITKTQEATAPSAGQPLFERRSMDDLRDRLARAEQNHINLKENFQNFKAEDFGSLKTEVHTMRAELNAKIDEILEKMNSMNLQMAKWVSAAGVLIFIGEFLLKKYFG